MSSVEKLKFFFRPDALKKGEDLFKTEAVSLSAQSDTTIQAYVRAGTPGRVTLVATEISSPTFTAECTCSQGAKGIACKHLWATILQAEKKSSDFLDSKIEFSVKEKSQLTDSPYKQKQAEFKKQQSEKMKARAKEKRFAKKNLDRPSRAPAKPDYPAEITEAIDYFTQNGFDLGIPLDLHLLKDARKKLSRIFHPDRGGSHDEATTLNNYYEALSDFLEQEEMNS